MPSILTISVEPMPEDECAFYMVRRVKGEYVFVSDRFSLKNLPRIQGSIAEDLVKAMDDIIKSST